LRSVPVFCARSEGFVRDFRCFPGGFRNLLATNAPTVRAALFWGRKRHGAAFATIFWWMRRAPLPVQNQDATLHSFVRVRKQILLPPPPLPTALSEPSFRPVFRRLRLRELPGWSKRRTFSSSRFSSKFH